MNKQTLCTGRCCSEHQKNTAFTRKERRAERVL